MKIELDIRDKLYNDICDYCELLGIMLIDYMSELIERGFFMDKYGDLNQVFHKTPNENEKEKDSEQIELYFEGANTVVKTEEKEEKEEKEKVKKSTKRILKVK